MAGKKKKKKKKAAPRKKVSRRGPMARTRRSGQGSSSGDGGATFSAPLLPMPQAPVYPPRDYEECAALVVEAFRDAEDELPRLGLTPEKMSEMLRYAKALQRDEERLARLLAKAGGARVAYDDKVWRTCLKLHELSKALADDHPQVAERFAFLGEYVRSRQNKGTKSPPSAAPPPPEG